MGKINIAQKFTDIEYLSKKEVANRLGNNSADAMWRSVGEYREKYRFPLDVKRLDHIPFSIVLTPSIMGITNATERQMIRFSALFEKLKNKQAISETKSLDKFTQEVIQEDLYVMAMQKEMKINQHDIEVMMDEHSMHLKTSILFGFYEAQKYLRANPDIPLDKHFFREVFSRLSGVPIEDTALVYRNHNNIADAADCKTISELMDTLFEFYNSGFELSPFVIAAVMYLYIVYIQPFAENNGEMAILTYMKVLADAGYGEGSYFLSVGEFILQKYGDFSQQFEEIQKSGDITYGVVFLARLAYDAIEWRYQGLAKIPEPEPSYGNVRVIEKIVEKIVEKEVPIYIEKPVEEPLEVDASLSLEEKEEPATNSDMLKKFESAFNSKKTQSYEFEDDPFLKFEEKNEEIPNSEPHEVQIQATKEVPVEEASLQTQQPITKPNETIEDNKDLENRKIEEMLKPVFNSELQEIINNEVEKALQELLLKRQVAPVLVDEKDQGAVEENKESTIEIQQVDKLAPSDVEKVQEQAEKAVALAAEEIKETIKTEPVKIIESLHDLKMDLAEIEGLEETEYAHRLVEMNPLLKYHQALFYATHRVVGRYYSIGQFKAFNQCAYETARTSMDFLTSVGLYRKEQVKNKFVYTPNK